MQMSKKKMKGMTLVEIVISIAIYGMIALLITEVMTLINATIRSTQQLNTRLSYEAKYADNLLTKDSNGVAFTSLQENVILNYNNGTTQSTSLPAVRVSIVYDLDNATGAKTLDRNQFADYTEAGGAALLRASEYETDYDGNIVGTNYHPNTNYKFMTFNKVSAGTEPKPEGAFVLALTLDDADAAAITKIEVEGPLNDGTTSRVLTKAMQSGGSFATGQVLNIDLLNNAPATGDLGTTFQDVTVKIYKNVIAPTSGKNLGEQIVSESEVRAYTAVQVSTYENYYTTCSVSYAGDSWTFPQSS